MGSGAALAIDHSNLANIAPRVSSSQFRERFGCTTARSHQFKSARTVRGIDHSLGCDYANTSLRPRDYSAYAKIMGLDGHAELPGDGIPCGNRIGMAQCLTRSPWFFAKLHSAFFTSSG